MSLGVKLVKRCPTCGHEDEEEITDGITYNLMPMFEAADWYYRRYDGFTGAQLLPITQRALAALKAEPDRFKKLNPANGWGSYDDALWFFSKLVEVCERCPTHAVEFYR